MEEQKTIAQVASSYESPMTMNVSDLQIVQTDWKIVEKKGKDNDGKEFAYNVIEHQNHDYRVPNSVLASLKDILANRPDLKTFKVIKSGQGMQTRYTVVPIQ